MDAFRRVGEFIVVLAVGLAGLASFGPAGAQEVTPRAGTTIQMGVGHFARDAEPFRHWDKEKEIPAACSRCHGATGLAEFLREGKTGPAPHARNAFACANCHADMLTYARHAVKQVTFPSGLTVDSGHNDSNLCMTCHQGRESTASVNKAINGRALDTPDPKLEFVHVHYFPAGATRFGTQAKGAYEYPGKTYAARFDHAPLMNACTSCHDPHAGRLVIARCGACHQGARTAADLPNIRGEKTRGDFDGNGREEGFGVEIANLQRELYAAIVAYAKAVGGSGIAFAPAHPYWYADTNGNGRVDPEEMQPKNTYRAYTPRLVQATYNYTYVLRDPGAAYHNPRYTVQILHDTLESLAQSGKAGVTASGKARP